MEKVVIKRDGRKEKVDINKIRNVIRFATDGIEKVDPVELETSACIMFNDEIKTEDIQNILISTALDHITVENPQWNYVAERLMLYDLYKKVALDRKYKIREKEGGLYKPYNPENFVNFFKENRNKVGFPYIDFLSETIEVILKKKCCFT